MASSSSATPGIHPDDLQSFHEHLSKSRRVLALLGAGLSASSGLPTFRGAGGLWRTHEATELATPQAFRRDPGLVWQFYNYRRHMSLQAQPNAAHYALAEFSRKNPAFMTLSQNVDGLSQRANHPAAQLQLLHGTLFELSCANASSCGYRETNFTDPVVPALAIPTTGGDPTANAARQAAGTATRDQDISNINVPIPHLKPSDLPQCPQCKSNLLRPGVVWFGEQLPARVLRTVDNFINATGEFSGEGDSSGEIDLILVIGTSAKVYPAAGFIGLARNQGARVCVVNMDAKDAPPGGWQEGDWMFCGDAAVIVPQLLKPVIGDVRDVMTREGRL